MHTSESIKEIATALNLAQAEMTAAKKDADNPFFKSRYADLGAVIKAFKAAFANHGLSYTQAPVMEDNKVGVVTRIMHKSGEWMEASLLLPMVKMDPQAAGSAITYARRYALQSMVGLPAADDDAEFAMARLAPERISKDQAEQIRGLLVETGTELSKFLSVVKADSVEGIAASQFEYVVKQLTRKRDKKQEQPNAA